MKQIGQQLEAPITFGLVHGSWHGAWCWDRVIPLLEAAGHQAVAIDLPIDSLTANYETHADLVAQSVEQRSNIVLVGHSRAGNIIPRVASRLDINKLIYLCAAIRAGAGFVPDPAVTVPTHFGAGFKEGIIIRREDGLTEYDKQKAAEIFYHDCRPEVAAWAISKLRPQNRSDNAPTLSAQPAVPTYSILCTEDRVVNPEWSRFASQTYLGVSPVELPGGHSPFLSRPELLAETLVKIATA